MGLPTDSQARKNLPIVAGCLDYFPDALLAVAELSVYGNEKHNPGQPLHWSKDKSNDHADCAVRHLMERGKWDLTYGETKPVRHSTAAAWRALANLQIEIENERAAKPLVEPDHASRWRIVKLDGEIHETKCIYTAAEVQRIFLPRQSAVRI